MGLVQNVLNNALSQECLLGPRNSTWFTRPFFLMTGQGLRIRLASYPGHVSLLPHGLGTRLGTTGTVNISNPVLFVKIQYPYSSTSGLSPCLFISIANCRGFTPCKKKKKAKVTSIREIKFTNATVALFLGLEVC